MNESRKAVWGNFGTQHIIAVFANKILVRILHTVN